MGFAFAKVLVSRASGLILSFPPPCPLAQTQKLRKGISQATSIKWVDVADLNWPVPFGSHTTQFFITALAYKLKGKGRKCFEN